MKTLEKAKVKNETETAVDNYLESIGVTYSVKPAGVGINRDGWTCDGWLVSLSNGKNTECFDYYTGTGHRVIKSSELTRLEYQYKGAKTLRQKIELAAQPFAPFSAGVIHSLTLESLSCAQNFNNWCADFGYDNDSIKAFKTYQACCENAEKVKRIFSRDQIQKLSEILSDY